MRGRVLLSVKAFKQQANGCGLAAVASIAHFYDKGITYKTIRKLADQKFIQDGMYTYEQATLLNELGFGKVTVVSADMDILDISWNKRRRSTLIKRLRKGARYWKRKEEETAEILRGYSKWLDQSDENRLIIDSDFPKYIRRDLSNGRPVGASFNVNSLFKMGKSDDIKGEPEQHAVVLRGYDDKGVFVVDMNFQYSTRKETKKPRGFYKLSWEKFLCNMPSGDLLLVG